MSTLQVANIHFESTANNRIQYIGSNTITISTAGNEDVRIDSAGNIGIGTTSPASYGKLAVIGTSGTTQAFIGVGSDGWAFNTFSSSAGYLTYSSSTVASIGFGSQQAIPLAFFTSNIERMRLSSGGFFSIGHTGSYAMLDVRRSDSSISDPTAFFLRDSNTSASVMVGQHNSSSVTGSLLNAYSVRSQSASFSFIGFVSNISATPDTEFYVRGDGATFADGAYTGTGADYAEFFEWLDGNPNNEDRRGISVVLENGKIKPASNTDTNIIGVISANPTVVGDASWSSWQGKYLRDEYGSPVMEDCEVWEWTGYEETTDPNGNPTTKEKSHSYYADNVPAGIFVPEDKTVTIQERWKLNPDFDPSVPYVNRADRKEWSTVGLMGKLRVRKGQPVGDRWIKLKDVTETVEEWLVR